MLNNKVNSINKILVLFEKILNLFIKFYKKGKSKRNKVKPPEDNYPLW